MTLLPLACRRSRTSTCCSALPGWSAWSPSSALILVPALGSYGRTWEKAAAGVLSVFVLVALRPGRRRVGMAIVYYWDDILNFLHGH